jgi:hypothetical protein
MPLRAPRLRFYPTTQARWLAPLPALVLGACAADLPDAPLEIETQTQSIKNGSSYTQAESPFVQLDTGCSGTLLRNDWAAPSG